MARKLWDECVSLGVHWLIMSVCHCLCEWVCSLVLLECVCVIVCAKCWILAVGADVVDVVGSWVGGICLRSGHVILVVVCLRVD